jgi:hypothetical protein
VLALSLDGRLAEVYRNDGSTLAAATAVAASARHILIGSMSDPGLLLCQKE